MRAARGVDRDPVAALIVVAAIGAQYLAAHRYRIASLRWDALGFLIAPLGFVAYLAFQYATFHDPFAFLHVYKTFWSYHHFTPNIAGTLWEQARIATESVVHHRRATAFEYGIPLFFWLAVAALWASNIRKLSVGYNVFMFGSLLLFVLNGNLVSVSRYVLPLFPTYLILARIVPEKTVPLWVAVSACFMAAFAVAYAGVYFTA